MKKIVIVIVSLFIMVGVCACGPKEENLIEFGQTFEYEDFTITFTAFTNAVEEMKDDDSYNLEEDGYAYKLTYEIEYANEIDGVIKATNAEIWPKRISKNEQIPFVCFNANKENNYEQVNSSYLYLKDETEPVYVVFGDIWIKLR